MIKKYCYFFALGLVSPSIFANSFTDSFAGTPKINATIYVFAADINGTLHDQNIKYNVDQSFNETLKHLDQAYMTYIDINKGDWGIYFDKQLVKTSTAEQVFNVPLAIKTKLDQSSYGVYYQAYKSPNKLQNQYSSLIIEPTIGIHHTEANATLAALGNTKQAEIHWNEFFWGTRLRSNFDSPWNLASQVTIGVKDTIAAHFYVGYRIPGFNRDFNLRVGYRYLKQDYESNGFHWKISERGPVIGINLPIF
ncbi:MULTISPECIES: hypothetical protein [unclassified Acinetobacter]|uniref:hypothetical protein n=1 Tax=unclassified Acinetobacter TaxID=196816 RepID=UPI00293500B7|nr:MULTISPECIES: hypothetical protein [unclassified Acinetobacter]WOE31410.1 hypothetical protein QSG84_13990 [Acinetobacter sp. SAAs470]WOE39606.1 hypothetical protein QSG86_07655 [Acinetobacter sp. SAAs474]